MQAYQRPEQTQPVVGQRYCLKSATAQQYMRVMDVQHEVRTFETPEGKEFQRRVVKMEISDALVHDFPGVAYPSPTYANPPSQLLETQVADTASYYGVRPLAAPITAQSGMIQVDQIYEKLVPTSIIETAFADQFPTGAGVWMPPMQSFPPRIIYAKFSAQLCKVSRFSILHTVPALPYGAKKAT